MKEAVLLINNPVQGWFLPSVQRPYVWGSRYESELYICKLFDSLLRGYPIGGIILWNTDQEIPYREFMHDFVNDSIPTIVDKGQWSKPDKSLVYDGQQRLQTLYSCLRYTFNGKVLVYDLLFDLEKDAKEMDETGFSFVSKNDDIADHLVRMNEIFSQLPDGDVEYEEETLRHNSGAGSSELALIRKNLKKLWKVFVETDKKSLAFFPIKNKLEVEVNEVFQRLNTGGVPLSQADLLLSRIKESYFDFEEGLQVFSKQIYDRTSKGYIFSHYEILQLIYLLHKETMRIDPKNVDSSKDVEVMNGIWKDLRVPLESFFVDYIWGQFKINNSAIIPRARALLPMMVYFFELFKKNITFKRLESKGLQLLNQYFILSQVNDWNLQSFVDNFARNIKQMSDRSDGYFDFPLQEFLESLKKTRKREIDFEEARFAEFTWFGLKILMPNRVYQFDPDATGRFSPEIDHIFPQKMKAQSKEYYDYVDIIWNMQPVKGEVNNFKRRKHPKEFFAGEGSKYLKDYDYLPSRDLSSPLWNDPIAFIKIRRVKMLKFLEREYGLSQA